MVSYSSVLNFAEYSCLCEGEVSTTFAKNSRQVQKNIELSAYQVHMHRRGEARVPCMEMNAFAAKLVLQDFPQQGSTRPTTSRGRLFVALLWSATVCTLPGTAVHRVQVQDSFCFRFLDQRLQYTHKRRLHVFLMLQLLAPAQ